MGSPKSTPDLDRWIANYADDDVWGLLAAVAPHAPRLLLWGARPGTGKTHAAIEIARAHDKARGIIAPPLCVTMTEETPAAEIRGFFAPAASGGFQWIDGPMSIAFRQGRTLVINEIGRASADVLSLMFAAADSPASAMLTLPNGDTIVPADGYRLIATSNGAPEELPDPLRDRLTVALNVNTINPAAVAALPARLQSAATGAVAADSDGRPISIRAWGAFASLSAAVGDAAAARAVFGAGAGDVLAALALAGAPAK